MAIYDVIEEDYPDDFDDDDDGGDGGEGVAAAAVDAAKEKEELTLERTAASKKEEAEAVEKELGAQKKEERESVALAPSPLVGESENVYARLLLNHNGYKTPQITIR
jgi:hypothetical protein